MAGSADSRYSPSGTAGASARQPVVLVALQRRMLVTDRMFRPPMFTTYAVPVRGMSAKPPGNELYPGPWREVARRFGGRLRAAGCHRPVTGPGVDRRQRVIARIGREHGVQRAVDRDEARPDAGRHGRRRSAAASRRVGIASGAVNDRHRPAVELVDEVGDVDGVAGLVDGERERAGTHRHGCRDPPAAAAGLPIARGPVDHRHGARGDAVRHIDGVGRAVNIEPGRAGLVGHCPGRAPAPSRDLGVASGRVDHRDATRGDVRHIERARDRVDDRGDRSLPHLDRRHRPASRGSPARCTGRRSAPRLCRRCRW